MPRHALTPTQHSRDVGPGEELKKLLARFRITAIEGCSCEFIAQQMNLWGPDECERPERIEWVLAGMRENAAARGLPFVEFAAKLLIRRAIKLSRNSPKEGPPPVG